MEDPRLLARELIDVPSVTGSESAIGELLERKLQSAGFTTRRFPVAEDRFNLLATRGTPTILLSSHIDTVPPFFSSHESDGFIYGRGACDTKGIIAAMLVAGIRLANEGVSNFGFLFVVGEETDSIGARRANIDLADLGSRFLINGEPTESRYVRASKGALTATVRFEGVAAHSAYPERGDSAISRLVAAIAGIEAHDWGSDPLLGRTTVNVGIVRGGVKPNIVPAEAEAEMIFRTAGDPSVVVRELERIVSSHRGEITRQHGNAPTFMHVPGGGTGEVVAYNTDIPHLSKLGQPILFGPGSILDAHTERERIAVSELLEAVETYQNLVRTLSKEINT